jgi:hypothetical protein
MARQTVAMVMLHTGTPRDEQSREELAAALGDDATVGPADEVGMFEVELDANDLEAALGRVWDAVAASGTDDHLAFLEHPDLPGHWRARSSPAPQS